MLQPGTVLQGRFAVERLLGLEATGPLYLVRHAHLPGRAMVLHELIISLTAPEARAQALEQFRQQAGRLFDLHHPNLVRVSDIFAERDHQYLVVEHVEGVRLDDLIRRSPAPLPVAVVGAWVDEIAAVLEYLHKRTPPVIMRCLGPANCLVDVHGRVRLLGFELARLLHEPGVRPLEGGFGAPELSAGPVDVQADQYSLGATLYALLTRSGPPPTAVRERQLLTPSHLNTRSPADLDKVVTTMLALRPSERYPSLAEARRALTAALVGLPSDPPALVSINTQRVCAKCGTAARPLARSCIHCDTPLTESPWRSRDERTVCPTCLDLLAGPTTRCETCDRPQSGPAPTASPRERIQVQLVQHASGVDDASLARTLALPPEVVRRTLQRLRRDGFVRRRSGLNRWLSEVDRPWWARSRVEAQSLPAGAHRLVIGWPAAGRRQRRPGRARRWLLRTCFELAVWRQRHPDGALFLTLPRRRLYIRMLARVQRVLRFTLRVQIRWVAKPAPAPKPVPSAVTAAPAAPAVPEAVIITPPPAAPPGPVASVTPPPAPGPEPAAPKAALLPAPVSPEPLPDPETSGLDETDVATSLVEEVNPVDLIVDLWSHGPSPERAAVEVSPLPGLPSFDDPLPAAPPTRMVGRSEKGARGLESLPAAPPTRQVTRSTRNTDSITDEPPATSKSPTDRAHLVQRSEQRIDVWSCEAMPLETSGRNARLEAELREAALALTVDNGQLLHVVYESELRERCDAPTAMTRHTDGASFHHSLRHGVRYEREFVVPADGPLAGAQHHHLYTVEAADAPFTRWAEDRFLADWTNAGLADPVRMESVWIGMKKTSVRTFVRHHAGELLGVSLHVKAPASARRALPWIMKPLLEGVIATFHRHDGPLDPVVSRLSSRLKLAPVAISDWLRSSVQAVLGDRLLVVPAADGTVTWNPADHLCVAVEILMSSGPTDQWRHSGRLFTVKSKAPIVPGPPGGRRGESEVRG